MQVSTKNDHVTHAVIGGSQMIEARISDKADFFTLLSSTLYSNQKLAVVREVICNAWDAHIAAGCTDRPIEITITKDHFLVQDFGTGIAHDKIGEIYLSYGDSTKTNDGKQTGGFGLGCKAPFAYNDHFEVISSHEGTATIYALSRSSAKANGKPGATPITQFPKAQSGLSVKVPMLPGSNGHVSFTSLTKSVVYQGDMNVILNGDKVDTLGMKDGSWYSLFLQNITTKAPSHWLSVRYGNVIYPIPDNPTIQEKVGTLRSLLNQVGNYQMCLVVQAPPHSISVTPSRESLSMVTRTIDTLNALLTKFIATWEKEFMAANQERAIVYAENTVKHKNWGVLFSRVSMLPRDPKSELPGLYYGSHSNEAMRRAFTSVEDLCKVWVNAQYPLKMGFPVFDLTTRVTLAQQAGHLNRGEAKTFIDALQGTKPFSTWQNNFDWFSRRLCAPLLTKLYLRKSEYLNPNYLRVTGPTALYSRKGSMWAPDQSTPAKLAQIQSPATAMMFLRKIVLISYTVSGFYDRAQEVMDKKLGSPEGCFLYRVARKAEAVDAAIGFFTGLGYQVIDLTKETPSELAERTRKAAQSVLLPPVEEKPKKPRKKGYPSAAGLTNPHQTAHVNLERAFEDENHPYIQMPEWFIKKTKEGTTDSLSSYERQYLCHHYGDKGCVVKDKRHEEKLIAAGVEKGEIYLRKQVTKELMACTDLIPHLESEVRDTDSYTFEFDVRMRAFQNFPKLATKLNIEKAPISDKTSELFRVFLSIRVPEYLATPEQKAFQDVIDKVGVKKELIDLDVKITKSTLLPYLHLGLSSSNLKELANNPAHEDELVDFIIYALER